MNEDIKQLNEKIDFLTDQVTSLTNRLKTVDDFKEDMSLFAKDAFEEVVNFMSEVDFHFRSEDLLGLIKKVFRNINNISKLLDQLQSFVELTEDLSPLATEIVEDFITKLYKLEQKGVFEYIKQFVKIIENLSENFEPDDLKNLGDFISLMTIRFKQFIKPENLNKMKMILEEIENYNFKQKRKVSFLSLFNKARSKEVLKGTDIMLDIVKISSKHLY